MRHIVSPEDTGAFTPAAEIGSEHIGLLPTVSPRHCDALNALYRCRAPIPFSLAGLAATFALAPPAACPLPGRRSVIRLRLDDDESELRITRALIETLLARVDAALSLDRLAPEHAALIAEFALDGAVEALEASLACRLSLLSIVPECDGTAGSEQVALTFTLAVGGLGSFTGELRLPAGHAERLAKLLDEETPARPVRLDLPAVVAVRVANATLTARELRGLRPGDVVLVDRACASAGTAIAVFGEHLVAPVELTPAGSRLAARPTRGRGSAWEWSMEKSAENLGGGGPEDADLGDLPVQVKFELGRIELSLNEIQGLAAGAVLQVARPAGEAVDIVANGRRIGLGTMVRIGDSLGVRITRLFGNG
jgi:type III secretion protein Q